MSIIPDFLLNEYRKAVLQAHGPDWRARNKIYRQIEPGINPSDDNLIKAELDRVEKEALEES